MGKIKRIWWQFFGVLLFNFPFFGHLAFAWLPIPVLNCYSCPLAQGACPVGTIQHFLVIGSLPLFVVGFVGVYGVMAGRFYCSHLCPFGFLQDLLAKLSRIKIRIPQYLGYGKYAVLVIMVIILPPLVKEPFFCTLCPAGTLEAGIPIVTDAWIKSHSSQAGLFGSTGGILGMIGWWFWFKIGILVSLLAASAFVMRPFCRSMCPLGALLGLFNRLSLFIRHPGAAVGEQARHNLKTCPVHITHPKDVDSHNCIKCRECYRPPVSGK